MVRSQKSKFLFFVSISLMLMGAFPHHGQTQTSPIVIENAVTFSASGGETLANGVNNHGMIVGGFFDGSAGRGFLRNVDGSFTVIDPPGALFSSAADINDEGTITGNFRDALGDHGFVRNPDGVFETFDVPGATRIFRRGGINNHGVIVGYADLGSPSEIGFIRHSDGTVTLIPELARANGINDDGLIVGRSFGKLDGVIRHPDGTLTEVQVPQRTPDESQVVCANDINNNGIVVGTQDEDGETSQFFRHLNGESVVIRLIGTGGIEQETWGVNDSGVMVGNTGAGAQGFFTLPPDQSLTTLQDAFPRSNRDNRNEGANHLLVVQKKGQTRALVSFNLALLPSAEIEQATLSLTLAKRAKYWGRRGRLLDVHRLVEPFTEGNGFVWKQKKQLRERGEGVGMTWNCAADTDISNKEINCDHPWNGGSDAIEMVTDSVVIKKGQTGKVMWDVTTDVQAALEAGDTEIRWLIKKALEEKNSEAIFYSREGAAAIQDLTKAPRLELQFAE